MHPSMEVGAAALRLCPVGEVGETDPNLKSQSGETEEPLHQPFLSVLFVHRLISWTVVLFSQLFPGRKKALPISGRFPSLAWPGREWGGWGKGGRPSVLNLAQLMKGLVTHISSASSLLPS